MAYKVETTRSLDDKIIAWPLTSALKKRVLRELRDRLSTTPAEELGRRVLAPVPCVVVNLVVEDASGADYEFTFWIDDTEQVGARYVLDGQYRTG